MYQFAVNDPAGNPAIITVTSWAAQTQTESPARRRRGGWRDADQATHGGLPAVGVPGAAVPWAECQLQEGAVGASNR
jgi:hypothetical protein